MAGADGSDGSGAATDRRLDHSLLVLALAPLLAVGLALAALHVAGLTGVDSAAHAYKTSLIAHGQALAWDDLWYAGSYGVLAYGAGYYLLAALVGSVPVIIVSGGLLPLLFHLYVTRAWGVTSRVPTIALAAVVVVYLANGQDPFLLAMALTMAGLALLAAEHPVWAALPVGLAALTNPVAVVVGAVFVAADGLAHPGARRRLVPFVLALLPFAVVWLGLQLAFRAHVSYLHQPAELLKWTAVAAVGVVLARLSDDPDRRAMMILFAVAGCLCVAAIVVPGELGNNAARFLMLFGLPALLMVRRVRLPGAAKAAIVAAVAALLLAAPVGDLLRPGDTAQTGRSFFAPALAFARADARPDYRCHVVALRLHWEAFYFPQAGLPITRGWFRQDDWQHNAVLYRSPTPAQYVAWLRDLGVRDVFVPHAALDQDSAEEPGLIARSGAFVLVHRAGAWSVYRLREPSPLVVAVGAGAGTAPAPAAVGAAVTAIGHDTVTIAVARPGRYVVKVTWTPYLRLAGSPAGAGGAPPGRLAPAPGDWTLLRADRPGTYVLAVHVGLRAVLAQIF